MSMEEIWRLRRGNNEYAVGIFVRGGMVGVTSMPPKASLTALVGYARYADEKLSMFAGGQRFSVWGNPEAHETLRHEEHPTESAREARHWLEERKQALLADGWRDTALDDLGRPN